jgi:hypothetical protein
VEACGLQAISRPLRATSRPQPVFSKFTAALRLAGIPTTLCVTKPKNFHHPPSKTNIFSGPRNPDFVIVGALSARPCWRKASGNRAERTPMGVRNRQRRVDLEEPFHVADAADPYPRSSATSPLSSFSSLTLAAILLRLKSFNDTF